MMKRHVDCNLPLRTSAGQPERWDSVRLFERNSSIRTPVYLDRGKKPVQQLLIGLGSPPWQHR
jgi:hypothetical protein